MIKILHTGDIHLGDLAGPTKDGANLRRQDTLRCMDAIVNKARTVGPDRDYHRGRSLQSVPRVGRYRPG